MLSVIIFFQHWKVSSVIGEELFREKNFCYLIQAFTLVRSPQKFLLQLEN